MEIAANSSGTAVLGKFLKELFLLLEADATLEWGDNLFLLWLSGLFWKYAGVTTQIECLHVFSMPSFMVDEMNCFADVRELIWLPRLFLTLLEILWPKK